MFEIPTLPADVTAKYSLVTVPDRSKAKAVQSEKKKDEIKAYGGKHMKGKKKKSYSY